MREWSKEEVEDQLSKACDKVDDAFDLVKAVGCLRKGDQRSWRLEVFTDLMKVARGLGAFGNPEYHSAAARGYPEDFERGRLGRG